MQTSSYNVPRRRHLSSVELDAQVDTTCELDMKYNLHECYVQLKQFTDAIHTVC